MSQDSRFIVVSRKNSFIISKEVSLSVQNVSYDVIIKEKKFFIPTLEKRLSLLDGINLNVPIGDLCAIMGPSGIDR
jgi:ABC-type glutathione transport system ATPase component